MKIALGAIALLLFAAISAQANEIPHCEVIPGGIRTPPQVFKDCVNGVYLELIFRDGYMIDCKGRKVCRLPEGIRMDVGIVGKDVKPSKADSPYDIGHACIIHKKDGQRTYLINKCSVDRATCRIACTSGIFFLRVKRGAGSGADWWTLGPLSDSVELSNNRIRRHDPNGLT